MKVKTAKYSATILYNKQVNTYSITVDLASTLLQTVTQAISRFGSFRPLVGWREGGINEDIFLIGVQRPNQRKKLCKGYCAGVDYNLTLRPLSRLQYIYHGQLCASVDSIPRSGT
jgi:hypothetical protein